MLKEFTSYAEKCSENNVIPMQVFQSTIDSIQVCMNVVEAPEAQLTVDKMSSTVEKVLINLQELVGLYNDPIYAEYGQDNVDEKETSCLCRLLHKSCKYLSVSVVTKRECGRERNILSMLAATQKL